MEMNRGVNPRKEKTTSHNAMNDVTMVGMGMVTLIGLVSVKENSRCKSDDSCDLEVMGLDHFGHGG
jgi:hypothetical protein